MIAGGTPTGPLDARRDWLTSFLAVCLGALLLRQLWFALFGYLNVDEFENAQVVWLWRQGLLPVRDYFHPHLITYNLLLAPIYALCGPTPELLGWIRVFLFPLVLLPVWQIGWIGRRLGGARAGWLAAVLFLSSPITGYSLAEMRPDTVALPLVLGALMCGLAYLERSEPSPRLFYAAALLLGLNFLFTQKFVFLAFVLMWRLETHHARVWQWAPARRWRSALAFGALTLLPLPLVIAGYGLAGWLNWDDFLLLIGSATQYVPVNWQSQKVKLLTAAGYALSDGVPLLLGLWGLATIAFSRGAMARARSSVPWIAGVVLIVSALEILGLPVLFFHLLVLPQVMLSLLAVQTVVSRRAGLIAALALLQLIYAHLVNRDVFHTRQQQVETFRYVLEHVPPDRPVLDFFSGYSAFRPIVGRLLYFRPLYEGGDISAPQLRAVVRGLATRRIGLVVKDVLFRFLPPALRDLILANYEPTPEYPDLLAPKGGTGP